MQFERAVRSFSTFGVLAMLFTTVGCAREATPSPPATPSASAKVVSASVPKAARPIPAFRMRLAGEPWATKGATPVAIKAKSSVSPAGAVYRPWGTQAGDRILSIEVTRPDDGRRFVLDLTLRSEDAKEVACAVASYRTTRGTLWAAHDQRCRVRTKRLDRDATGKLLLTAEFDLELRAEGESRPLVVAGELEDIALEQTLD
jgi:hypothetical protein